MRNVDYLEFGGSVYAINLEAFDGLLSFDPSPTNSKFIETETTTSYDGAMNPVSVLVTTKEYPRGKEIDMSKYEMIKFMMDIVMGNEEEMDDSLGMQRALDSSSISFKIAFNTLLKYGILKEIK